MYGLSDPFQQFDNVRIIMPLCEHTMGVTQEAAAKLLVAHTIKQRDALKFKRGKRFAVTGRVLDLVQSLFPKTMRLYQLTGLMEAMEVLARADLMKGIGDDDTD
jgi:hypothetical protein